MLLRLDQRVDQVGHRVFMIRLERAGLLQRRNRLAVGVGAHQPDTQLVPLLEALVLFRQQIREDRA